MSVDPTLIPFFFASVNARPNEPVPVAEYSMVAIRPTSLPKSKTKADALPERWAAEGQKETTEALDKANMEVGDMVGDDGA